MPELFGYIDCSVRLEISVELDQVSKSVLSGVNVNDADLNTCGGANVLECVMSSSASLCEHRRLIDTLVESRVDLREVLRCAQYHQIETVAHLTT